MMHTPVPQFLETFSLVYVKHEGLGFRVYIYIYIGIYIYTHLSLSFSLSPYFSRIPEEAEMREIGMIGPATVGGIKSGPYKYYNNTTLNSTLFVFSNYY